MRRSPLIIKYLRRRQMKYSTKIKRKLFSLIKEMKKEVHLYVQNPFSDFVRNRKLSFEQTMKIILSMGGDNLRSEILSHFGFRPETASTSAFCQQRAKIKADAFETLFYKFNDSLDSPRSFKGYRLLACDGSTVRIPLPSTASDYHCCGPSAFSGSYIHLNALYDLQNKKYVDVFLEPECNRNEKSALIQMIYAKPYDTKTIFIADRGYESYNLMAHFHARNLYYLIRIKDNHAGGFARIFPHPDCEEYDESYTRIFTRKKAKKYSDRNKYTYIGHKYDFDFFTPENDMYQMEFRILRIKTEEDKYECIVTNLPKKEFNAMEIKSLYKMRWGIETSFRELKYAVGLSYFHSKKEELILQEIFARLIVYNFCQSIALHTTLVQKECK